MTAGVCPTCGLPGIPYLYGYPSGEGMELAHAGRVVLGGCVVWPGQPDTMCPRGHEWDGALTRPPAPRGPKTSAQRKSVAGKEATASAAFAAGRYEDAERVYRTLIDLAVEQHGDDHPETDAFRHALTLVLDAAGRTDDAAAAFAPIRARREARREVRLRRLFQDPR